MGFFACYSVWTRASRALWVRASAAMALVAGATCHATSIPNRATPTSQFSVLRNVTEKILTLRWSSIASAHPALEVWWNQLFKRVATIHSFLRALAALQSQRYVSTCFSIVCASTHICNYQIIINPTPDAALHPAGLRTEIPLKGFLKDVWDRHQRILNLLFDFINKRLLEYSHHGLVCLFWSWSKFVLLLHVASIVAHQTTKFLIVQD